MEVFHESFRVRVAALEKGASGEDEARRVATLGISKDAVATWLISWGEVTAGDSPSVIVHTKIGGLEPGVLVDRSGQRIAILHDGNVTSVSRGPDGWIVRTVFESITPVYTLLPISRQCVIIICEAQLCRLNEDFEVVWQRDTDEIVKEVRYEGGRLRTSFLSGVDEVFALRDGTRVK